MFWHILVTSFLSKDGGCFMFPMRGEAVVVVGIVAILLGAGVGYLAGGSGGHAVTSVSTLTVDSTSTATITTTMTVTAAGTETVTWTSKVPSLQLFGSVWPPGIVSGQNVTIDVGIYNPLPAPILVNVSAFADPYLTPCGVSGSPDAWGLFRGHVTFSNISSATQLQLYNASFPVPCFRMWNSTFNFQPDGSVAVVAQLNITVTVTENPSYNYSGSWVRSANGDYRSQPFMPGQYTAYFFDVWGQRLLEYFVVDP